MSGLLNPNFTYSLHGPRHPFTVNEASSEITVRKSKLDAIKEAYPELISGDERSDRYLDLALVANPDLHDPDNVLGVSDADEMNLGD